MKWEVYVTLYKFVRHLKSKVAERKKSLALTNPVANGIKTIHVAPRRKSLFQKNVEVVQENPEDWNLPQLSFTRQLAFGPWDTLSSNGAHGRVRVQEFYNSRWSNLLAKLFTVVVLLVTVILFLAFYFMDRRLEQLKAQAIAKANNNMTQ